MRQGGGKAKGSAFERKVCQRLSLWVSEGKQYDCYWRSAMSGGRSTVAHARGKRLAAQSGDISCIHSIGQQFAEEFFCECKFYKDLDLASLLIGKGKLAEFWSIASQEAARYDKSPFLIAKENRRPVLACLDGEGLKLLQLTRRCSLTVPPLNLYIVLFSTFETKAVKFWQE